MIAFLIISPLNLNFVIANASLIRVLNSIKHISQTDLIFVSLTDEDQNWTGLHLVVRNFLIISKGVVGGG